MAVRECERAADPGIEAARAVREFGRLPRRRRATPMGPSPRARAAPSFAAPSVAQPVLSFEQGGLP
eukprot:9669762-Alexandrium_andersonii.AAC.1